MDFTYTTTIDELPSWFAMPCIACEVIGSTGKATALVSASSGLGLASCTGHVEVTERVLRRLHSYEVGLRTSFVTAGIITEPTPQHDRATGDGVVYGRLPGSGGGDHSVTDVMLGRAPR
ncbi:hypothetical protein [Streptomyces sp. NPDC004763]